MSKSSQNKKWNMIVDVAKCNNCYNCFVGTKDEYVGNEHKGYTAPQPLHGHQWVDIKRAEGGQWPMVETQFRPEMCNHCDDAPCLKVAKNGAIKKRADGIVIIDPEKSKGQREIVDACPYGAVFWNEELEIPQAWPFDAHLLDHGWKKTKIEQCCPTDVFKSVKVTDEQMLRIVDEEELSTLGAKDGAKPRVYYKNAQVFNAVFIGGTVITEKNGVEDCLPGAVVLAKHNGEEIGRAESDAFGDFKIEKLTKGLGNVTLDIQYNGDTQSHEVQLGESIYIGTLSF
jgi:Fe-S-cluster-containing dehydrogenase component